MAGQGAGAEHAEGWANERDAAGLRDANHPAADAVLHQNDADQRRGGQNHRGTQGNSTKKSILTLTKN